MVIIYFNKSGILSVGFDAVIHCYIKNIFNIFRYKPKIFCWNKKISNIICTVFLGCKNSFANGSKILDEQCTLFLIKSVYFNAEGAKWVQSTF
jgi:hypothetical protein